MLDRHSVENPYQASLHTDFPSAGDAAVTAGVLAILGATRPWVRICAIIGLIGTAFSAVVGAVLLFRTRGMPADLPMAVGYLLGSAASGIPSFKLWRYTAAISRLLASASPAELDQAMDRLRSFWRAFGVAILVFVALMALMIVAAIFASIARSRS